MGVRDRYAGQHPRLDQDEAQWGPAVRPLVGGTVRGITVATFTDKYGNKFTRYYGGQADGPLYGRRLDPSNPRIHEEVPSYVPPRQQVRPQA